jgi:TRAP-type C4-dicarboxylate transport system substrate-binding protein
VKTKRTNGRVQFELTSLPELGFGGGETLRVLRTGIVDVAEVYGGYVAGELPIVEILELPGIFPDGATGTSCWRSSSPTTCSRASGAPSSASPRRR